MSVRLCQFDVELDRRRRRCRDLRSMGNAAESLFAFNVGKFQIIFVCTEGITSFFPRLFGRNGSVVGICIRFGAELEVVASTGRHITKN